MLSILVRRSASTAVFLEHNGTQLSKSNLAALRAAHKIASGPSTGVLLAANPSLVQEAQRLPGLSKLLVLSSGPDRLLSEAAASALAKVQEQHKFTHWLACHSTVGKELLPRLAALLARPAAVADITDVAGENTFRRPIYAGAPARLSPTIDAW